MRFTIRDLLWLTALVALGAAWWVDRRGIQKDRDIWRYHAEGAMQMASWHANGIVVSGREMKAKHHTSGTYVRTWPEESFWYDNPAEGPNRPKRPKP
jgi:hypothetical protein